MCVLTGLRKENGRLGFAIVANPETQRTTALAELRAYTETEFTLQKHANREALVQQSRDIGVEVDAANFSRLFAGR